MHNESVCPALVATSNPQPTALETQNDTGDVDSEPIFGGKSPARVVLIDEGFSEL